VNDRVANDREQPRIAAETFKHFRAPRTIVRFS
jgi:hypothetical protein